MIGGDGHIFGLVHRISLGSLQDNIWAPEIT